MNFTPIRLTLLASESGIGMKPEDWVGKLLD